MTGNETKMQKFHKTSLFVFVCVLSLTLVDNVFGTRHQSDSNEKTVPSKFTKSENQAGRNKSDTDIHELRQDDLKDFAEKYKDNEDIYESNSEQSNPLLRDFVRQKRSAFPGHRYGFTLREGPGVNNKMKRVFSDYGYGSRLQAGENIANSHEREGLFGFAGPGKRSDEMTDFDMLVSSTSKDKRINTDYGYGSRLQAAENVAMDWDRNGLFGLLGPGKRNYNIKKIEATKRLSDFGYGSRAQAAENAATSSSHGGLYGLYGPGKRSSELLLIEEMPEYEISKRLTSDYGYGSRMQASENVAQSASQGGLFGVHGPGKRGMTHLRKRFSSDFGYGSRGQAVENLARSSAKGNLFGVHGPGKRISSDFGYGSREQVAENLAKSLAKGKVFGIYGPGKRFGQERNIRGGETIEADSGYGSRIQAGSQIAKDVVAIDNLFGLLGPGR